MLGSLNLNYFYSFYNHRHHNHHRHHTTITMFLPRAFSEPIPIRIDPIWKQASPIILPRAAHIPPYRPPRSHVLHSRSQPASTRPTHSLKSLHPSRVGSTCPLEESQTATPMEGRSKRRDRCWFMNILMGPCDFVEWGLKKWGTPSRDCMNCVKVTYWIVLIVGGIVSTVMAVAPFL